VDAAHRASPASLSRSVAAANGGRLSKQGTEAMKKTVFAAGLVVLAVGAVGCKTTPKLAFWKSKSATDSATAVAHSAPQLPSDVAKQSGANQPNAAQIAGGQAAPFVPTQTAAAAPRAGAASSYPATAAPPFSPEKTGVTTGATAADLAKQTASSNLGSISMPYDPTRPPAAAKAATDSASIAAVNAQRYGSAAAGAANRQTDVIASAPSFGGFPAGSRYGAATGPIGQSAAPPAAAAPATNVAASTPSAAPVTAGAAGRYGEVASATVPAASAPASRYGAVSSTYTSTTPTPGQPAVAPAVASTAVASQPYRPGGTSSYPGVMTASTQDPVKVAARPAESTAPATTTTTPPAATTPTTPAPSASAPRYW
jgi:hypothetical protein